MGPTNPELSIMRSTINQLMPDTCNILTSTETNDGQGGAILTYGTTGTAIACRLDVVQGREQQAGGAVQAFTSYMLSIPYGTTINYKDMVEIGSNRYEVTSLNNNQSWKAVTRVGLELV